MKLNAYSDFLFRSLIYVAIHNDRLVTAREIAESYGLSVHHTAKVCKTLIKHGVLESQRGRGGGVKLAKPAEEIQLGDILFLASETENVINCHNGIGGLCKIVSVCRLKRIFAEAQQAFFSVMNQYTLADLINQPEMADKIKDLLRCNSSSKSDQST